MVKLRKCPDEIRVRVDITSTNADDTTSTIADDTESEFYAIVNGGIEQ